MKIFGSSPLRRPYRQPSLALSSSWATCAGFRVSGTAQLASLQACSYYRGISMARSTETALDSYLEGVAGHCPFFAEALFGWVPYLTWRSTGRPGMRLLPLERRRPGAG